MKTINKMLLFVNLTAVLFMFAVSPVLADLIWPIPEFTPEAEYYEPDYLLLVNRQNPVPENWDEQIHLIRMTGSYAEEYDVMVEEKTYNAWLDLKEALAAEDIHVEVESAYRSMEEQQLFVESFTERYGEEKAKQYAAAPGYSEHHTGLALDLYFSIDGIDIYLNEDWTQYPEICTKIHEKLPEFGFILRYPEGKEEITGYSYEPWHIRYIDDPVIAKEITEKGLTLEEYLFEK